MWFAYKRDDDAPGHIIRVSAKSIAEDERYLQTFICPECGAQTFFVKKFGNPGEKGYRPPHFKHQKKDLCETDVCELRIENRNEETYISQKIRTPLFLRPVKNGKFTLAAGFSSADKELLKKLWNEQYRKIQIQARNGVYGSTSLESLIANGDTGFIDLLKPIYKQNQAHLVAVTQSGKSSEAFKLNDSWAEFLDWFGNPACTGALFSCEPGSSGQKIMAGDFVQGGEEYLLMFKETGWKSGLLNRTLPEMEKVGYVSFPEGAQYSVFQIRLPRSGDLSNEDYNALANYLQENFSVLLCDCITEFEPVWPPAAQKSNAFLVEKMPSSKDAIVSVNGLDFEIPIYIHRNTETALECPRKTAGRLSIASIPLTASLQPVSCELSAMSGNKSFRIETLQSRLVPMFYVQQVGTEILWNAAENHVLELPENPDGFDLRSNCGFTLYGKSRDMHVAAGEKYHLVPQKDSYLVVTDPGQIFILHTKIQKNLKKRKNVRQTKYLEKYLGKYQKGELNHG